MLHFHYNFRTLPVLDWFKETFFITIFANWYFLHNDAKSSKYVTNNFRTYYILACTIFFNSLKNRGYFCAVGVYRLHGSPDQNIEYNTNILDTIVFIQCVLRFVITVVLFEVYNFNFYIVIPATHLVKSFIADTLDADIDHGVGERASHVKFQ